MNKTTKTIKEYYLNLNPKYLLTVLAGLVVLEGLKRTSWEPHVVSYWVYALAAFPLAYQFIRGKILSSKTPVTVALIYVLMVVSVRARWSLAEGWLVVLIASFDSIFISLAWQMPAIVVWRWLAKNYQPAKPLDLHKPIYVRQSLGKLLTPLGAVGLFFGGVAIVFLTLVVHDDISTRLTGLEDQVAQLGERQATMSSQLKKESILPLLDQEQSTTSAEDDEYLQTYYRIYQNPFVIHIRQVLDAYLQGEDYGLLTPEAVKEPKEIYGGLSAGLDAFDKSYYQSKFIVIYIAKDIFLPDTNNVTLLFQDKSDRAFNAVVQKVREEVYDLVRFEEDYYFEGERLKTLIEESEEMVFDREHAL